MLENYERIGGQISKRVNIAKGKSRNALIHLPDDYETNTNKYPLLVFHCGAGETTLGSGKGAEALLKYGPPRMVSEGDKFHVKNPNTGAIEKFIVLSLQQDSTGYALLPDNISYAWENEPLIKDRYDPKAVFMTGLSLGGIATSWFFSDQYADDYLQKITAFVLMSAKLASGSSFNFKKIQEQKTPGWVFCGKSDASYVLKFTNLLIDNVPDIKVTWYNGGHCCWHEQYKNKDIYEWCLAQVKPDIPEQPIKIISSTPQKIVVQGPALEKTALLKLGAVDVEYIVNA